MAHGIPPPHLEKFLSWADNDGLREFNFLTRPSTLAQASRVSPRRDTISHEVLSTPKMAELAAAPVLSTPDDHILEVPANAEAKSSLSDDALATTYEISRTAAEIRAGGWPRIALQFPDHMLVDAPRIVEALNTELEPKDGEDIKRRIYVLADTSYSACCVDEIAAEHAAADVVVHYGRTCLSPTSRLPVIYVYTSHELDHGVVVKEFEKEFTDKETRVVVMADLTYQDHVSAIVEEIKKSGYPNVLGTEVVRNPEGMIPNRRIAGDEMADDLLKSHALFHISDPPTSLLLALQSRFASFHVLSTQSTSPIPLTLENPTIRTAGLLRRRFARVLSLASAGVIGILVNTLSVSNYVSSLDLLRTKIAKAGKKSYTMVVGKLNPAKLANFSEIEGWVIVGCWESGLIEDDAGYWRPVVTPFELEVALTREEERIWGGDWWGGIEKLKLEDETQPETDDAEDDSGEQTAEVEDEFAEGGVEGDESLPPEFDFRTGKLVSHSRPMRLTVRSAKTNGDKKSETGGADGQSEALVKKAPGELASINGVTSPGAEFLRSQRTWQGLGSDFDNQASTAVEEGRSGIARGYQVGEDGEKH